MGERGRGEADAAEISPKLFFNERVYAILSVRHLERIY